MRPLFEIFEVDEYFCTQLRYTNKTYEVIGQACKEEEKIRRIEEYFGKGNFRVVEAYSDDPEAMLDLADEAFLVENGNIELYQ